MLGNFHQMMEAGSVTMPIPGGASRQEVLMDSHSVSLDHFDPTPRKSKNFNNH